MQLLKHLPLISFPVLRLLANYSTFAQLWFWFFWVGNNITKIKLQTWCMKLLKDNPSPAKPLVPMQKIQSNFLHKKARRNLCALHFNQIFQLSWDCEDGMERSRNSFYIFFSISTHICLYMYPFLPYSFAFNSLIYLTRAQFSSVSMLTKSNYNCKNGPLFWDGIKNNMGTDCWHTKWKVELLSTFFFFHDKFN